MLILLNIFYEVY